MTIGYITVPQAMVHLSQHAMTDLLAKAMPDCRPDTFIETGTADATTACCMLNMFEHVHTIELSDVLYQNAIRNFGNTRIKFHHGDSATILPQIIEGLDPEKPVVFFLDAHSCADHNVYGGHAAVGEFPLWDELRVIKQKRTARDLIIVDDIHAFGREGTMWETVNPQSLVNALVGPGVQLHAYTINDCLAMRRAA